MTQRWLDVCFCTEAYSISVSLKTQTACSWVLHASGCCCESALELPFRCMTNQRHPCWIDACVNCWQRALSMHAHIDCWKDITSLEAKPVYCRKCCIGYQQLLAALCNLVHLIEWYVWPCHASLRPPCVLPSVWKAPTSKWGHDAFDCEFKKLPCLLSLLTRHIQLHSFQGQPRYLAKHMTRLLDCSWAARYKTGLLIELTPKGVVFSFLAGPLECAYVHELHRKQQVTVYVTGMQAVTLQALEAVSARLRDTKLAVRKEAALQLAAVFRFVQPIFLLWRDKACPART